MWGVEISEESVACAIENAELNGIANAAFFAGEVGEVLNDLRERAGEPDVVVVDPPRAGLAGKALRRTGALEAPRLVYVSCNPTTLASDLKVLRDEYGYELERCTPVDMFPHTPHIESVSLLTRAGLGRPHEVERRGHRRGRTAPSRPRRSARVRTFAARLSWLRVLDGCGKRRIAAIAAGRRRSTLRGRAAGAPTRPPGRTRRAQSTPRDSRIPTPTRRVRDPEAVVPATLRRSNCPTTVEMSADAPRSSRRRRAGSARVDAAPRSEIRGSRISVVARAASRWQKSTGPSPSTSTDCVPGGDRRARAAPVELPAPRLQRPLRPRTRGSPRRLRGEGSRSPLPRPRKTRRARRARAGARRSDAARGIGPSATSPRDERPRPLERSRPGSREHRLEGDGRLPWTS